MDLEVIIVVRGTDEMVQGSKNVPVVAESACDKPRVVHASLIA